MHHMMIDHVLIMILIHDYRLALLKCNLNARFKHLFYIY